MTSLSAVCSYLWQQWIQPEAQLHDVADRETQLNGEPARVALLQQLAGALTMQAFVRNRKLQLGRMARSVVGCPLSQLDSLNPARRSWAEFSLLRNLNYHTVVSAAATGSEMM